jgi:tetratricopeptide (TPR) repeat protein
MNAMKRLYGATSLITILLSACAAAPGSASAPSGAVAAYGPFLAARYADARQDPEAAIHFYNKALADDPHNQALINEDFIAAVISGNPQAPKLARQVSGNAIATMLLGNQAAIDGDYNQAMSDYARLPQDDLSGLLSPLLTAWATAGAGNPAAALNNLIPHISSGSPFAGIYVLNAALIADEAGDTKNAAQFYQAAEGAAQTPNLRLAQILASWKARQGDMTGARAELESMAASHPSLMSALPALNTDITKPVINSPADGLAEAYLAVAGSLNDPSQNILRLTFLRFALALRPDLAAARLLLADSLTGAEGGQSSSPASLQMTQALAVLKPIPPRDPLYNPAALQEASLMGALGQTHAAVALLNQLIAQNPGDIGPLQEAGDVLRDDNQFNAAIPYYSRAIAALPDPPPAGAWTLYYDRGISIDQGGDWTKAEPDLQQALRLAPNQPFVLNYLGYTWALRNENLPKARQMLTQAVSLAPNEGAIIDSLGFVNLKTGDTSQAMQLLIKAVEMDPDDAEVNAHLGDAFYAAGEKLQAGYQWQRALALQPDAKLQAQLEDKLKQVVPPG